LNFSGKPFPVITWKANNKLVSDSKVVNTERSSTLSIPSVQKTDAGEYNLNLSNTSGQKDLSFKLKVLDKPGAPGSVKVSEVSATKAKISWEAPEVDGGAPVTSYVVQKRETSKISWTTIAEIDTTAVKVASLLNGSEYIFRVMGVNAHGVGEAAESRAVTAQNDFSEAGRPSTPKVTNITAESCVVGWEKPANDGGSEVTGYVLEKREANKRNWSRVSNNSITETRYKVTGLKQGTKYEFRVSAENAAGIGEASLPSNAVLLCEPTYAPGALGSLKVLSMTKTSVSLAWGEAIFDGGAPVTGYALEYGLVKEEKVEEWKSVLVENVRSYTLEGVQEGVEYCLRYLT